MSAFRRHAVRAFGLRLAMAGALLVASLAAFSGPGAAPGSRLDDGAFSLAANARPGQVVARDGRFWRDGNPVVLHGYKFIIWPTDSNADATIARAASWGINSMRVQIPWAELETTAPIKKKDGTWSHTWNSSYLTTVDHVLGTMQQNGLDVLLNNGGDRNYFFGYPDWLYQAKYNSKAKDYEKTPTGLALATTDCWSDTLRQQFMIDYLKFLASHLSPMSRIMGYEILNEPAPGLLPTTAETTQAIVDWQLKAAKAIRTIDVDRMIVFTTRAGYGPGLRSLDLSHWLTAPPADPDGLPQPLGFPNIAFDVHDYFGGRWGGGTNRVPGDPSDGQSLQDLYVNTLPGTDGVPAPPYIGTTLGHVRWLQDKTAILTPLGIAMLVGEVGVPTADPNAELYWGTAMSAMTTTGTSFMISGSTNSILDTSGNYMPYANIVIDALGTYP
jgi:hypothetical protein